jgi:hypothetical protein
MKKFIPKALLMAVISLGLASCWPAQTYDKNGLSFNYPGSWAVIEDEYADQVGYVQLEKKDSQPQATIIFGWMESNAEIAADMMLAGIFSEMQSGEGLTDVVTEDPADVSYGPYPARAVTYTAKLDGAAVAGAVWVFRAEGRVVNVAIREGAGGGLEKEFKSIKDSFTLKPLQ